MQYRLFTPGPTPVPEQVRLRMAQPLIYHRSAEFRSMLRRVTEGLQYVFQTRQPVLTLATSGTGGLESTFVSLFSPGDTIIAVNGGKFGARWAEMPREFGLKVIEITVPWGDAVTVEEVRSVVRQHPEAKAVYLTHCETSTGTVIDLPALAAAVREESEALVCVDAVSSLCAQELRFDAWGLDACVTASQKGLGLPPGLAFVAMSERAVQATASSRLPKFSLDLRKALRSLETYDTPFTPAISLIAGADEALRLLREEGIENIWARHARLAEAVRAGITVLGLSLFSHAPSNAVTAVHLPPALSWPDFNATLRTLGVVIAGGQGMFAGKIFRVAHLGFVDEGDCIAVIAALEQALARHRHPVTVGAGVAAAQGALLRKAGV